MSGHWEAPRIAYELAAKWTEGAAEQLSMDSGGAHAHLLTCLSGAPGLAKDWYDLSLAERRDVLNALGTQARSAVWEVRRHHGLTDDDPIMINMSYYTLKMCESAREDLVALTDPSASKPWKLPECSHCAALVAEALISIEVSSIMMTGVPDPAAVLWSLAGRLQPAVQGAGDATN